MPVVTRRSNKVVFFAFVASILVCSSTVIAASTNELATESDVKYHRAVNVSHSKISYEDAKLIVQKRYGGTVLRIWMIEGLRGQQSYHVRVLSSKGRVDTHVVDTQTGEIVK